MCIGLSPLVGYTHFILRSLLHSALERPAMSESDISPELLDTPVSYTDVAKIAADFLASWEELSPHLELTPEQEAEIRNTFKDYGIQKREALRRWKKNKGNTATYRAFTTAATATSNMELVDRVKAMLQTKGTPATGTGTTT